MELVLVEAALADEVESAELCLIRPSEMAAIMIVAESQRELERRD